MKQIEIKVISGASYFAVVSQRLGDISSAFEVDTRTVRRWASHPLWERTLDVLGYAGDRSFQRQPKRDVERDSQGVYEAARQLYQDALRRGIPQHQLTKFVSEESGVSQRKIRDWVHRYNWKEIE